MNQMDKYFSFGNEKCKLISENAAWRQKDVKGNRKTFYIKEVTKKNDLIMNITPQTKLEKLKNEEDRWPCLNARKMIKKVRIYI